jgi:HK97 family phage prohead protease
MTEALKARSKAASREVRTLSVRSVEVRADATTPDSVTLTGFASTTESPYQMQDWLGPYTEVVRAGAFTKTLSESADVRLLLNHDGLPLARTKSGTLELEEVMPESDRATELNGTGLYCTASLDASSSLVQDIRSAMSRGDLDQMSFAFSVTRQQWSPDYEQRDILEVQLFDVSVVTYPANPATSATVRAAVAERIAGVVPAARAKAIRAELREGKALSASSMEVLQQVLDLVAAADIAVDEAQPLLADLMGVPNPDEEDNSSTDDPDEDAPDADDPPNDDGSTNRSAMAFLAAQAVQRKYRARSAA